MRNKVLCLIPARKGSKRLPGKNVKPLLGKPLISYTIDYAIKSSVGVIVSTNDEEIEHIVSYYPNVRVSHRQNSLAKDDSHIMDTLFQVASDYDFDILILLQPTNPLRPPQLIEKVISIFETSETTDMIISVSRSYRKLLKLNSSNSKLKPVNYSFGQRSQDLDHAYYENGLIYGFRREMLLNQLRFTENNQGLLIEDNFPIIDIDTAIDFSLAEIIMSHEKEQSY